MPRGRRAEGFPSHIEYLKPKRNKRKSQLTRMDIHANRVFVRPKGGGRKKALKCPYFNKVDNHCYKNMSATKYCSLIWNIPDIECIKQKGK